MANSSVTQTTQKMRASGFAALFGLFAGLCTIFATCATLADWYNETRQARWPVVSAVVDRGDLVESGRAQKNGGGTGWNLRYRVHYEVNWGVRTATLYSNTIFSDEDFQKLKSWAALHRKGSQIDVRYDPSREDRAVFASAEVTDAVSRLHNDLVLITMFATLSAGLLALARFLRAREIKAPPATSSDSTSQGGLGMGLLFAGLGLLVAGGSAYRAVHAEPYMVDNFMGVPAGLMFVFAGILLALPLQYKNWRNLLATLLITCFAVTFDWVAFGPGERHFSGSFNGFGFVPSELFGRVGFGFFAIILDICAIWMWIDLCRRAFGLSTGQGLSRIGFFGEAKLPTD
jgi:Protein of unknown function (DUF3592)